MKNQPQILEGFSEFFQNFQHKSHFATHSHHPWPDVSFQAQQQYWHDSVRLLDQKWDDIFEHVLPKAQTHIARILNVTTCQNICFAPNTHSFVLRLLSSLEGGCPHIITTDSEFHSFNRQAKRLAEAGRIRLTTVPTAPFESFPERFEKILLEQENSVDMVFISQVFFNSGFALTVDQLRHFADQVSPETIFAIDGYHGFMAVPTDLSCVQSRCFYLAGGYKYAMSGEGACFIYCPDGYAMRPVDTGWYAGFGALEKTQGDVVPYATDGSRFFGSTFDVSGVYRFNAVMDWLVSLDISVEDIHNHVHHLQNRLLAQMSKIENIVPETLQYGHFLGFKTPNAEEIYNNLLTQSVVTDYRGDLLRIGLGVYHNETDVDELSDLLQGCNF